MAAFLARLALVAALALPAAAEDVSREIEAHSFAPLIERTAPAVVNIYARKIVRSRSPTRALDGSGFWRLFRDTLLFGYGQDRIANSLGSGVVVAADGVVVTNRHVIADAEGIQVALIDGRVYAAKVLVSDPRADIAVLRIIPEAPLSFIAFADSDRLRVGDRVLAIGNPFGLGQTVTSGIVSAVARTSFGVADFRFFIQTDAAINPGNSGGAQIDLEGRLLGINTAIFTTSGGSQGLGFAVPSNMVKPIVEAAVAGRPLVRPWIGISGRSIPPQMVQPLRLPGSRGVLVFAVHDDGPAAKAGFAPGDVILTLDGAPVDEPQALRYRVATRKPGDTVRIVAMRGGQRHEIAVTVVAPPEVPERGETKLAAMSPLRGARIASLSPALAEEMGADSGISGVVVLDVGQGSTAARIGLRPGDIVRAIDGREIETAAELAGWRATPFKPWRLVVTRAGANIAVGQRAFAGFAAE